MGIGLFARYHFLSITLNVDIPQDEAGDLEDSERGSGGALWESGCSGETPALVWKPHRYLQKPVAELPAVWKNSGTVQEERAF